MRNVAIHSLEENASVRTKILSAILEDPEIIFILKEKYVDESLWKYCIEREPKVFRRMTHPSKEICYFACEVDGANLKWVRYRFSYIKITGVLAFISVKSNPKAILYVPDKLLSDGLLEMAFDQDPSLMGDFDNIRPEYLQGLLKRIPSAIQYVNHPDEDMVCELIREHPTVCAYIHTLTDRMMEVLKVSHPNHFQLFRRNLENKKNDCMNVKEWED